MSRRANELDPTLSLAHYFGAEIRRRRDEHGMTQHELASRLLHSPDLVRKVESAQRFPSREFVALCDDVLGAGGALARMWPLLQREHQMCSHQRRAAASSDVFVAGAEDRHVLDWLIAPRAPSRRAAPDDKSAAEILDRLRRTDRSQGAGATYPQLAMHLRDSFDELATRAPRLAAGYLELAGYESVDLGADGLAQGHYLRALQIVSDMGDRCYASYLIGVSLAHLALHAQDAAQAERLATAALRGADGVATPRVRAALHAVAARARARQGDEHGCTQALTAAETALGCSTADDEPEWIRYFGEADLADERAHCLLDLGRDTAAEREAATAVTLLSPSRVRRLAIDTALRATALVRSGEVDGACDAGRDAIDHAARTTSYRSMHRAVLMLAHLQPYESTPAVRDVIDYAASTLPAPPSVSSASC